MRFTGCCGLELEMFSLGAVLNLLQCSVTWMKAWKYLLQSIKRQKEQGWFCLVCYTRTHTHTRTCWFPRDHVLEDIFIYCATVSCCFPWQQVSPLKFTDLTHTTVMMLKLWENYPWVDVMLSIFSTGPTVLLALVLQVWGSWLCSSSHCLSITLGPQRAWGTW